MTLGKLITQRSQVQILSPQRYEAAGHGPAASFTSARSGLDPAQTANGLQTQQSKRWQNEASGSVPMMNA